MDKQRIKSVSKTANTTTKTKYYLGNYEEEHLSNGKVRKLHYIYISSATAGVSGSDLKAIYVQYDCKDTLYYTHTDYQGNLLKVTSDKGKVIERYAYDPWGLRRNPTKWNEPETRKSFLFDRGYTLHEHLDDFGLVNMNGRVYDPLLAQFLSPDPYIQAPGNWLNYNRYAYGFNNPLMFTDPDGEFIHLIIGAAIGGVINLGIKAYQGKINSFGDGVMAFGIGAVAGAVGAATGGVAFLAAGGGAAGAGGFLAGAVGGMVGSAFASPIQSIGNSMYFGDPMMTGKQYLMGITIGGLVGGTINGGIALGNGKTFMTGDVRGTGVPTSGPTPTLKYDRPEAKLDTDGMRSQLKPVLDDNRFSVTTRHYLYHI